MRSKLRQWLTLVPLLILSAAAASAADLMGSLTHTTIFRGYAYRVYVFSPSPETSFRVVMRSDDFDPYLMIVRPDGTVLRNDVHAIEGFGQTGRDAGIAVTHPEEGTWTLVATTTFSGSVGDYTLVFDGLRELQAADVADREASISEAFAAWFKSQTVGKSIRTCGRGRCQGGHTYPRMSRPTEIDGAGPDEAPRPPDGGNMVDHPMDADPANPEDDWLPALLPWPPPSPSSQLVIDPQFLREAGDLPTTLAQVDTKLQESLSDAGYSGSTYWGVPGGFAVVTPLEQTDADGAPLHGQARWTAAIAEMKSFSLAEYVKALFTAPPGYFRVLAFVVSPQAFAPSDSEATLDTIARWSRGGLSFLPDSIGQEGFTERHRITVLVYEFQKRQNADQPVTTVPGRLTARAHLAATDLAILGNR